ncbi:hypothetical protein A2U01_0052679, partial [Trifolium medium]|nr:hypothetical protein [Trifolium medium]
SVSRQGVVASMGYWNNEAWQWRLEWTVPLLPSEDDDSEALAILLVEVQPVRGSEDRRKWIPDLAGMFSVVVK